MAKTTNIAPLLLGAAAVGGVWLVANAKGSPNGWYYAFIDQGRDGTAAYNAMLTANKGKIRVTKTVSPGFSTAFEYLMKRDGKLDPAWILFEKLGPFDWTLPGKPAPAPQGEATQITDVLGNDDTLPAITSPEHPWNKFWSGEGEADGGAANPLIALWRSLGNAGPIVVYGSAAIILFKLANLLPSGSSSRSESAPFNRRLPAGRH